MPPYFEGGQLPLVKRLPYRRGFVNPNRVEYQAINLGAWHASTAGSVVGPDELVAAGSASTTRSWSRCSPLASCPIH